MNFDDCPYSKTKIYISKEEEEILYEQMKDGSEEARDDLIMGHKYLVIQIAREYAPYGPYEDLVQEGFLGLINAVDKYDLKKNRLRSYARPAVKYAIVKFLAKNKHIVRLPEPQTHELLKLLKIKRDLEVELHREPNLDDLMKDTRVIDFHKKYQNTKGSRISLKDYVLLIEYGNPVSSLNEPVGENSEIILQDLIEDPWQQKQFEKIEFDDLQEILLEILNDRERFILKSIAEGWNGSQIAEQLGITPQGVSMTKIAAVSKIKKIVKSNPELEEIINDMGFQI